MFFLPLDLMDYAKGAEYGNKLNQQDQRFGMEQDAREFKLDEALVGRQAKEAQAASMFGADGVYLNDPVKRLDRLKEISGLYHPRATAGAFGETFGGIGKQISDFANAGQLDEAHALAARVGMPYQPSMQAQAAAMTGGDHLKTLGADQQWGRMVSQFDPVTIGTDDLGALRGQAARATDPVVRNRLMARVDELYGSAIQRSVDDGNLDRAIGLHAARGGAGVVPYAQLPDRPGVYTAINADGSRGREVSQPEMLAGLLGRSDDLAQKRLDAMATGSYQQHVARAAGGPGAAGAVGAVGGAQAALNAIGAPVNAGPAAVPPAIPASAPPAVPQPIAAPIAPAVAAAAVPDSPMARELAKLKAERDKAHERVDRKFKIDAIFAQRTRPPEWVRQIEPMAQQ